MPQSRILHLIGMLLGAAFIGAPARATEVRPESPPVRVTLRVDWSNPKNHTWHGAVKLGQGQVTSARLLELRPGQTHLLQSESNEVHFSSDGPASWCGIELIVEAPPQASVELTMDGDRLQTRLDELLQGSVARMSGEGSARLRRDPADILRVTVNRPHLIFGPGELAELFVEFNLLAAETSTLPTKLQVELYPAREVGKGFSVQEQLQVPTNAAEPMRQGLQVRMPESEGVYDLLIRVEPTGLRPVERVVQFVVLNPSSPATNRSAELATRLVEEIDPSNPAVNGPWYSKRRLMARTTRLGQFLWSSVRHPFGSSDRGNDSPVNVCRLNVKNPGRPHLVSVDYEDNGNLLLAASVSEQDPEGRWYQMPLASGVKSTEKPQSTAVQSHQLVFWPRTTSTSLSLYIENATGMSAVKKVRLYELPQGLPALDVHETDGPKRLFGLYVDNPDTWASWGSSRGIDSATGLGLDDWRTFLDSANHLTDYARFAGYNCLQITVVGQGGAMYPTNLLDANYRLDSGSLADPAPDPIRKDFVELLLRICARKGLSLMPSLRFDGPIAALDRTIGHSDSPADGMVLVSREGKAWDAQPGSNTSLTRRYNPLNPDVQAAMLEVIREFVQRYASHPGFEGLALDLATQSHLVLPGLDWGYDDRTMEQFAADTGMELPAGTKDDAGRFARRHQLLTSSAREQWNAWRGRQLAGFHEAVLAELQRSKPRTRLVLDLTTLVGSGTEDLREAIRTSRSVEDALKGKGIDLRNWAAPRDIIVLRPFVATGASPEALHLNSSRELDELMAKLPGRGSLCVHEPEVLHLAVAANDTQRAGENRTESISVPLTAPGRSNLRRLAQGLASRDCQVVFEGGPAIPLGQEQVQREFARVFRSLPGNEFQSIETLQPVVVRSCHNERDSLVYLVNDASFPVETTVSWACPAETVLTNGSTGDRLSVQPTEHGIGTKLTLESFQIVSLRLASSDAAVAQCKVTVPLAADKGLKLRFERLTQAMTILGRDATRTLDGLLPNGDFEEMSDGGNSPAHWNAEGESVACVSDSQTVHGGKNSLRLTASAGNGVLSDAFAPPAGRALALNVWLRADRPGLRVRWFLVGNHGNDTIYRCYADVPIQATWEQKQFRARDLPDGQLTNVHIRFQLLDAGTIWVDEARICALPISKDEHLAITKSVSAIFKAWTDRRLSDFERLADGYWANYLIESVEGSSGSSASETTERQVKQTSNM